MIFLAVNCKQSNEAEPGDGKRTLQKLKPNWTATLACRHILHGSATTTTAMIRWIAMCFRTCMIHRDQFRVRNNRLSIRRGLLAVSWTWNCHKRRWVNIEKVLPQQHKYRKYSWINYKTKIRNNCLTLFILHLFFIINFLIYFYNNALTILITFTTRHNSTMFQVIWFQKLCFILYPNLFILIYTFQGKCEVFKIFKKSTRTQQRLKHMIRLD